MPKNVRQWARQEIDRAHNNIDWSGTHLMRVIELYEGQHPEVSEPLTLVCSLLQEAQKLLSDIKGSF